MPTERKTVPEMSGEFMREASVLILVFGILDGVVGRAQDSEIPMLDRLSKVEAPWVILVLTASVLLWIFGTAVERLRGS